MSGTKDRGLSKAERIEEMDRQRDRVYAAAQVLIADDAAIPYARTPHATFETELSVRFRAYNSKNKQVFKRLTSTKADQLFEMADALNQLVEFARSTSLSCKKLEVDLANIALMKNAVSMPFKRIHHQLKEQAGTCFKERIERVLKVYKEALENLHSIADMVDALATVGVVAFETNSAGDLVGKSRELYNKADVLHKSLTFKYNCFIHIFTQLQKAATSAGGELALGDAFSKSLPVDLLKLMPEAPPAKRAPTEAEVGQFTDLQDALECMWNLTISLGEDHKNPDIYPARVAWQFIPSFQERLQAFELSAAPDLQDCDHWLSDSLDDDSEDFVAALALAKAEAAKADGGEDVEVEFDGNGAGAVAGLEPDATESPLGVAHAGVQALLEAAKVGEDPIASRMFECATQTDSQWVDPSNFDALKLQNETLKAENTALSEECAKLKDQLASQRLLTGAVQELSLQKQEALDRLTIEYNKLKKQQVALVARITELEAKSAPSAEAESLIADLKRQLASTQAQLKRTKEELALSNDPKFWLGEADALAEGEAAFVGAETDPAVDFSFSGATVPDRSQSAPSAVQKNSIPAQQEGHRKRQKVADGPGSSPATLFAVAATTGPTRPASTEPALSPAPGGSHGYPGTP